MSKQNAGILLFRIKNKRVEVFSPPLFNGEDLSELAHADFIVGNNFIDLLVISLPTSNQLQMQNSCCTYLKTSGQVDADFSGHVEWNTQLGFKSWVSCWRGKLIF